MSQNRTIRAILALDIDKRALGATEKAIDRFNAVLDTTRKRTVALDDASDDLKKAFAELARQDALNKIAQDLAKAETEGRDFNAALKLANAELVRLGASQDEINGVARGFRNMSEAADRAAVSSRDAATAAAQAAVAQQASGATAGRERLRGPIGILGTELRALPAVNISGNFSTDAIAKLMQVLDLGLTNLGPAGIAAGLAIGAAGLAFSQFIKDFNENTERLEARAKVFFEGLNDISLQIAQGATTEDIQAQIDAREQEIQSAQRQINDFQQLRDNYDQAVRNANNATGMDGDGFILNPMYAAQQLLAEASGGQITSIEQLDAALKIVNDQLDVSTAGLFVLSDSLKDVDVAANDAAEAERQRLNAYTAAVVRRSEIEADTLKFMETATIETANARIQAAEDELDRLFALNERLTEVGGESAQALIKENEARIDEQVVIRETTRALMESTVVARETAGAAIFRIFDDLSDRTSSLISAVGDTGVLANASTEIFALQVKIQDAAAKTAQAIDAINAKLAEAEAKALTDRENGLRDAITKANDAREKQETDHRDKLLAINAKANLAQNNAIGSRDALAFFQAQQTRKSELSEEARNNKRRLQEIDKSLKQQTEIVTRRYNEQVDAARKAASAQIAIENQKLYVLNQQLNAEIQQINSANAARLTLSQNYWNAQLATDAAGANAGLSIISQFWNGVLSTLSGGGIEHSSVPIIPTEVEYGSAASPNYSGLTVMQSPTNTNRIAGSTSAGGTAGGGGITINVPISGAGMTKRQLLREVDQRLNTTLTRAGYE